MTEQLDCALDLMRRLPPSKLEQNLTKLIQLIPDLSEDLLTTVDQPLKIDRCAKTGKEFLLCDYNRDGDSFRSPWSNEYQPATDGSNKPSPKLQKLEISMNEAFDTFRDLYYDGGVSSVFLWDLDDGFAGVILIKKEIGTSGKEKEAGAWDSIHVLEVSEKGKTARYRITSTIMLRVSTDLGGKHPKMEISGSMTRQAEQEEPVDSYNSHIPNIGRLVEDMEFKMRVSLQQIYFGKTKDVTNDLRSMQDLNSVKKQNALQAQLLGRLASRAQKQAETAANDE